LPAVFFITHPDVRIDPGVPVPEWPLNERGRARMRAMTTHPWARGVRTIFCSRERKARDGAQIVTDELRLGGYSVVDDLGENDRSATGYLPKLEFEATVDAFFAEPQLSVRGWERVADAQTRIIRAVELVGSQASDTGEVAIIGHGGTGALLYCHLAGLSISRQHEQPPTNGGNWFAFVWARQKLLHAGWRSIDAPIFEEAAGVVIETARLHIRATRDDPATRTIASAVDSID
jgi:broad specificity phosphatase PhoE